MHIGIVGAGALGGLFGGYLNQLDHKVTLVDTDQALVEVIEREGLRINRIDGDNFVENVSVTTDPESLDSADYIFLFVKAHHTEAAVRDIQPVLSDNAKIVTLQNGISHVDTIQEYVSTEQVLFGITMQGSQTKSVGHIVHTTDGVTKIGGPDSKSAQEINQILTDIGFETKVVSDPIAHIWDKQIVGTASKPVAALTGRSTSELVEHEETLQLLEQIIAETKTVAQAKEVEILTEDHFEEMIKKYSQLEDSKSSMLEDIEMERPTEIEQINGAVIRYADDLEISVPLNRAVRLLVRSKEAKYLFEN